MKNKKIKRFISAVILVALIALNPSNSVSADPGLLVSPGTLSTVENGSSASFNVSLLELPTESVFISVTSSETSEGSVNISELIFTIENWDTPQPVTVTPVDDLIADGSRGYTIDLVVTDSGDEYEGVTGEITITNADDDVAGLVVNPTGGLTTTELGGLATFTVRLATEPIDNVSVAVNSSDTGEGIATPVTLSFNDTNWNNNQTVTITGQDDSEDDGDETYQINLSASGSTEYSGKTASVSVTNTDNDQASLIIDPNSGLTTNENGGQDTFTVALATQPTQNFILGITSLDPTEGSVNPTSLDFTTTNWASPQTVTVTGINDVIVDGAVTYQIELDGSSGAAEYLNLSAILLNVQNEDNDVIGVTVAPTSGLVTTEGSGTDQFLVKLNSQPTSLVTINLSSSKITEGIPDPTNIVLNSTNWAAGVIVTVRGQNDNIDDDDQDYLINLSNTISSDPNYHNLNMPDVSVTNLDNDTARITLTKTSLETSEDGTPDNLSVYLDTQPTDNVTINISIADTTEGQVSPNTLLYNPSNYDDPQTVTVTGLDDDFVDGDQLFQLSVGPVTSVDSKYDVLSTQYVSVTNLDNDNAGFTISPIRTMITNEEGGTDRFTVVLDARPRSGTSVIIPITSTDTTEGSISIPLTNQLVFSSLNWRTPQEVIIVGVDDNLQDGNQDYEINVGPSDSGDPNFDNLPMEVVAARNNDNDTAGILLSQTDGLVTTEIGGTAQFSLRLNTEPQFDVTIRLSSTNTGEGLVTNPASPSRLTFTRVNWNIPQTVTLTGVDDLLADGDVTYQITFSLDSAGTDYDDLSIPPINILNIDNDFSPIAVEDNYYINGEPLTIVSPGVLVNDSDENGDTLTAVLESLPAQDPDINLNPDGSFTYQANAGFEGIDQFTYKTYDGISYSEIGIVNIEVDLTPPPIANWISPVTNNNIYTVEYGTILLRAAPLDEEDFEYLWFAWYDPTLPGGLEDQLVTLGTADTAPYSITINVNMLDVGFNQLFVFVFDKAGNRSVAPNNRIMVERLPYYSYQILMPIIFR